MPFNATLAERSNRQSKAHLKGHLQMGHPGDSVSQNGVITWRVKIRKDVSVVTPHTTLGRIGRIGRLCQWITLTNDNNIWLLFWRRRPDYVVTTSPIYKKHRKLRLSKEWPQNIFLLLNEFLLKSEIDFQSNIFHTRWRQGRQWWLDNRRQKIETISILLSPKILSRLNFALKWWKRKTKKGCEN